MEKLWQDIRYASRTLRANPSFTLAAVFALALGIGGNTIIFSVVNSVLLRPLPYEQSDRLMEVFLSQPERNLPRFDPSMERFQVIGAQNTTFENVGAFTGDSVNLTGTSEPMRLSAARVSTGLLDVLKVKPAMGRNFPAEEDNRGSGHSVILGHGIWQRQFGSDPAIVGKSLTIDNADYTVIGVMPAGMDFSDLTGEPADILISHVFEPTFLTQEAVTRGTGYLNVLARMKAGVTVDQVRADMQSVATHDKSFSSTAAIKIVPELLSEKLTGEIRQTLWRLFGAVFLVLLIACANVANLMLAKSISRRKEITIRAALGATRLRLIRQLLTESVMIGLLASVLGIFLATMGLKVLIPVAGKSLPRSGEITVDGRVLAFAVLISILTGIAFGLAPAIRASKLDLNSSLKDASRGSTGGAHQKFLRGALVVSEIALSLVLLIGAGLLIRSFLVLQAVNPGFNPNNTLVATINLPRTKYNQPAQVSAFYQRLNEDLATIPGVVSVGDVQFLPMGGPEYDTPVLIDGRPFVPINQRKIVVSNTVSADYFRTMSIPLLQGRLFTNADNSAGPPTAIINQSFARHFFPDENPLGKRVFTGIYPQAREIVGVVGDVRQAKLIDIGSDGVYIPFDQRPAAGMQVVIRSVGDPLSLIAAVRARVTALDKDQPVAKFETMTDVVQASYSESRFVLMLIGLFALVALALATLGIYSVMAYTVTQRTGEIGLRMALGAQRRDILELVLKQGMITALIGLVIGLVTALLMTELMAKWLYGVGTRDAITFIFIPLLLTLVALAACLAPALRAIRVDPLIALRYE